MASSGAQEGISERKQGKQPAEGLPPNEDLDMTKLSMATPKSLTADADSAPMQGEDGNEPEGEQQEPETPTKSKKKKNRPNKKKTKSPAVEIKAPPTKMEKAMAQATTEARRQELSKSRPLLQYIYVNESADSLKENFRRTLRRMSILAKSTAKLYRTKSRRFGRGKVSNPVR